MEDEMKCETCGNATEGTKCANCQGDCKGEKHCECGGTCEKKCTNCQEIESNCTC